MLRILTFPLVVKMQRNVAILNNFNPKLMAIQVRDFPGFFVISVDFINFLIS
jgi:hypothetical protein